MSQTVRELDVAFHAGNRDWNQPSVGVEHEGFIDRPARWSTNTAYRASREAVG
ncbi:N-acetylmuramoyl-L-alanine amidase [Streptomyces fulvoviolaceus]|uniref:peptidoglycan recognition protein family protein n=1 Tax=Streptomyces fulvoviolaceus TaxID=285535 RepID=UPI001F448E5D|nr:N-acetylmuramoyl-L-alanine amidase [Streptomyces fulvoviolaceus]